MSYSWRWELLTEEEKAQARKWVEEGDYRSLLQLQNKRRLSGGIICCNINRVKAWFDYAYENGLI